MSTASVRTSGRRDNLPVFPIAAGNKGDSGSFSKPVALRYWSRSSSNPRTHIRTPGRKIRIFRDESLQALAPHLLEIGDVWSTQSRRENEVATEYRVAPAHLRLPRSRSIRCPA